MKEQLHLLDIKALRRLLDTREISAKELAIYFLERIKAAPDQYNAIITLCEEEALKRAEAAQEMIDRKNIRLWTGIPVVISDNISTKGIRTTCASSVLEHYIPTFDATVTRKLKGYGAVVLGKANLNAFGTESPSCFGGALSPLDGQEVPGSAGGSAAAVAAGFCAAAVAADTFGTLRNSAAACGVAGIKPTYASVSRYGLLGCAPSMDQIGVITRYARDCGGMLDAITDYDPNDPTMLEPQCFNYGAKVGGDPCGLKAGIILQAPCSPSALEAILTKGCVPVQMNLPSLAYAPQAYFTVASVEMAGALAFTGGREDRLESMPAQMTALGRHIANEDDTLYQQALFVRQAVTWELEDALKTCDFLAVPTRANGTYRDDCVTAAANLSGLPAMTVTMNTSSGDEAVTLIGRRFDEATLIGLANAFEKAIAKEGA